MSLSPRTSTATVLKRTVTLGWASTRVAMALLARSWSRRTRTVTWLPYLARNMASSAAESPPPITYSGLLRKMGTAPSQTAQALIPLCQKASSPGRFRRRALAPVAMMTASAVRAGASSGPSLHSVHSLNGRCDRSTREMVSVITSVPNRTDCWRMFSISFEPSIPSGKPGKFSISVVVVSCPPAAVPLANIPSYRTGLSSARDR
ncbi:hypothetical protein ASPZODRAFT_1447130 [Penicilliopsis zonata CBS 506.65]|uniref:Uncharacterized protein n=1 Tax=Penicilliopsis zonata CBS 506.65 TaxID=1073090 RepID=A0A1L9SQD4_9EURO|nr:hypothetical protein ASPZODRAFT_1447130 [Penicilliopsis zonata CBS 506.65]OJJ49294.1 hypothetical protein ASPZODRAFT_1447130 [Penicilliopsis zonata CBS 506.65]